MVARQEPASYTLTTLSQFSQHSILHQGGIQLTEFRYAKLCGYIQSTVPIQPEPWIMHYVGQTLNNVCALSTALNPAIKWRHLAIRIEPESAV